MKKKFVFLVLAALMLLGAFAASAEEAQSLNKKCTFKAYPSKNINKIKDGSDIEYYSATANEKTYIEVTVRDGEACGIYIAWNKKAAPYAVLVPDGKNWKTIAESENTEGFIYEYLELPGLEKFRICPLEYGEAFQIGEMTVYSEGELPAQVQRWQPTLEKADLLVLAAHPDDEFIFMGGSIPYYAMERKKQVAVAYLIEPNIKRHKELLKGLWATGVRNYPVTGPFKDEYQNVLSKTYKSWGKEKVLDYVSGLFERFSPDVVITHDINGEYGHGAHRVAADAAIHAVTERQAPVKKLYIHLYDENMIEMNWGVAYESMDGKTPLEMAKLGFSQHRSQQGGKVRFRGKDFKFEVVRGGLFDNARFGLYNSTVGEDVDKNDFFENIER